MKAQIRLENNAIKIQIANKLIGNKSYGYALVTKVAFLVVDKLNEILEGNLSEDSLSSGSYVKYAPCEIEFRGGDKPHYNVTILNGDKKLKLGLSHMPFEFDSWFAYASGANKEKCEECGKKYKAVLNGATVCDCATRDQKCMSCGGVADSDYVYAGNCYCESCFYNTFSVCSVCDKTLYTDDCTYYQYEMYCEKCADNKLFNCHACGETTAYDDFCFEYDGREYCESCFSDDFSTCENCHDDVPNDEINTVSVYGTKFGLESWCDSCYSDAKECKECDEKFTGDDGEFCSVSCENLWHKEHDEDEEEEQEIKPTNDTNKNAYLEQFNKGIIYWGLDETVKTFEYMDKELPNEKSKYVLELYRAGFLEALPVGEKGSNFSADFVEQVCKEYNEIVGNWLTRNLSYKNGIQILMCDFNSFIGYIKYIMECYNEESARHLAAKSILRDLENGKILDK